MGKSGSSRSAIRFAGKHKQGCTRASGAVAPSSLSHFGSFASVIVFLVAFVNIFAFFWAPPIVVESPPVLFFL